MTEPTITRNLCENCECELTTTDFAVGFCTQCRHPIVTSNEKEAKGMSETKLIAESTPHRFMGHADAPTTWCVVPDSTTEHGYCGQPKDAAMHIRPDPAVIGGAALGASLFGPPKESGQPESET